MAGVTSELVDMLAIDPGGQHVGLALFRQLPGLGGWECWMTQEMTPEQFASWFTDTVDGFDLVVHERFTLYEDKAMSLIGSEMETSQLIGVIKYICDQKQVPWVAQPAAWQQPTLGLLRAHGIESQAKKSGSGGHCLSAELHGWAYLI